MLHTDRGFQLAALSDAATAAGPAAIASIKSVTSDPATAGPSTADPTTADTGTADPATADPATADAAAAEPTTTAAATAAPPTAATAIADSTSCAGLASRGARATASTATVDPAAAAPATACRGHTTVAQISDPGTAAPGVERPATSPAATVSDLRSCYATRSSDNARSATARSAISTAAAPASNQAVSIRRMVTRSAVEVHLNSDLSCYQQRMQQVLCLQSWGHSSCKGDGNCGFNAASQLQYQQTHAIRQYTDLLGAAQGQQSAMRQQASSVLRNNVPLQQTLSHEEVEPDVLNTWEILEADRKRKPAAPIWELLADRVQPSSGMSGCLCYATQNAHTRITC